MKKTIFLLSATAMLALTGCIAVDANEHAVDSVTMNTETALRVCGGPGMVKEVTDEGYTCHSPDD